MEAINLAVGNKLELELYDNYTGKDKPLLISQFESLLPDGTMEILAPIHQGRIYPVLHGTRMKVIFERNGNLFQFMAVAAGRRLSGSIFLLIIQPETGEARIQRRTFFRFNCLQNIKYRIFEHKDTRKEDRGPYNESITKDISGGGLCLLSNEKPSKGWYIEGVVNVGSEVRFCGRIVRVNPLNDKGKFKYEIGIEFNVISDMDREKVISFIFDSQRKLLKKGWSTK